jgi:hypothetical protein
MMPENHFKVALIGFTGAPFLRSLITAFRRGEIYTKIVEEMAKQEKKVSLKERGF